MYSTTRHGHVYLSNIKLSEGQTSKYLWRVHTLPNNFQENYGFEQDYEGHGTPNCAAANRLFSSVDTTLKSAAYFALFGLLGFSIVWLILIIHFIYYELH